MDGGDALTLGMAAYLVGSFLLHRVRLARLGRDGLELELLERLPHSRLPPEAGPVLAAIEQAEQARRERDAGAQESRAYQALGEVKRAGGVKQAAWLAYLDAQVRLTYLANPVNLELVVLTTQLDLRRALRRFGPSPELHLGLAHAEARLGQLTRAVDALARAVFYANGDPFFVRLVLDSRFVEVVRPRLHQECMELSVRNSDTPER